MTRPLIDVIIPTRFDQERHYSLVHQIKSALNQEIPARVILVCSTWNFEKHGSAVLATLSQRELEQVVPFHHADGGREQDQPGGYMCNPALLAYMESDLPAEWQLQTCDDDCLAPWALKWLLGSSHDVSMVLARAVAVARDCSDRRQYKLNETIERCHVGLAAAIFKTDDLRKLDRPWLNIFSGYGDWELIKRMADAFPYRFIEQIVNIQGLSL